MPSPDLGLNGPFLQRRLPDWLKHSTPAAFKHLSRSQLAEQGDVLGLAAWFTGAPAVEQQRLIAAQAQSRLSGRMLAVLLKDLKGIAAFAEPLLLARLKADYPALQIDVNTCQFVQITRESTGNGRWEDVSATRQSLLQAALQNFAASASFVAGSGLSSDGAYSLENHVIYQSPTVRYAAPVAISPSAFAGLCHALDLGQQYQQHLSTVFESPATQASLKQQWISVYKDLLRVRLQVALMKSEITDAARQALLALLQGKPDVRLNGKPVVVRQLSMYGVALADVWMISADRVASDVEEPVVVYLPGAPLYPLREYPSVKAFRDDLRINLRSPAYRQLLRGYVPREQAQWFFATLQQNLYHKVIGRDDVWESVFDPAASLKLRDLPLAGELFDTLYTQHLQKLKADARVLAVPSAKADEKARAERLAYWASVGLNVLNAAAFFVPYLGEVMAVVAAEQLIHSVIDGAHAWETGDRATAWAHLESVAINMAMVAGLAAVGAALPKVSPSELVDGLLPIELPGGERRLWRVDLSPYANPVELADVVPDAQGLYRLAGKQYVRIDQGVYEVSQDANGVWRIEHGVADAYRPVLRSNNQGAWQAYGEQPLKWSRAQLLRRLGPLTDGLSDAELAQAAEICATSDDVLRQVHVDQLPVPGLLADTLRRMRLDRQITRLVEGTRTGVGKGDGLGFLPALAVQLPRWPGRLLEVFSGPEPWGDSIVYGREAFGDGPVIKVTREQVHAAKLPEILLQALDEPACQQLFGDSVEPQARLQVLRDRLADQAEQRRASMFDSLYASRGAPSTGAERCVLRDFPGLPPEVATELASHATPVELESLAADPGRMPLRLAEEARVYLQQARLNQALLGLHEMGLANQDSQRLALQVLQQLPGWSATVRLELRLNSLAGARVDAIGPLDGALKVLVSDPPRYAIFDHAGVHLGTSNTLFEGLLKALPDAERQALGFQIGEGARLGEALCKRARSMRDVLAQALGMQPIRPWLKPPMRLASGRIGYPLSGRGAAAGAYSDALIGRVQTLYPALDVETASALLDELGLPVAQLGEALEQREQALQTLRRELAEWVAKDQFESVSLTQVRPISKDILRTVSQRIELAWRRQTPRVSAGDGRWVGYQLDLGGLRVGHLPTLSADLGHVAELKLDIMGLTEVPAGFLGRFSHLRWLSISGNRLARLPDAIANLSRLTKLHLKHNAIVLDAAANSLLASLVELKVLDLEGNPLGTLPNVAPLTQLRGLMLRRTGIDGWPPGVFELQQLEVLDLRENHIRHIPQSVLEPAGEHEAAVRNVNAATYLHGNPLEAESRARLRTYRAQTGLNLGIAPVLRMAHRAPEANPSLDWLVGLSAEQTAQRQAVWAALVAEPQAGDLFRLLHDLRDSADFKKGYAQLQARVWALLQAASEDSELRETLFEQAAHPQTCADGAVMVFSQLEVRLLVRNALAQATQGAAQRNLMTLAQGLFRLDRLESFALQDIRARLAKGEYVDEVEVRLAYRVGLADALALPGQPRRMIFQHFSGVTQADLDLAKAQVLLAETPAALKTAIAERDFWVVYLKAQYPQRFEQLNKPYFARLEAIEVDKTSMTDQRYKERVETIVRRRRNEEKRMIEQLTAQIWNDLPEQSTQL